jgi:hypothetical protein
MTSITSTPAMTTPSTSTEPITTITAPAKDEKPVVEVSVTVAPTNATDAFGNPSQPVLVTLVAPAQNEPVNVVGMTNTDASASSTSVTDNTTINDGRANAISAAVVDQIAQRLAVERAHERAIQTNTDSRSDPLRAALAAAQGPNSARQGPTYITGAAASQLRPMGGIHGLSSSSSIPPPEQKRRFEPVSMPIPSQPVQQRPTTASSSATPSPSVDPQTVIQLDTDEKKTTKIAIRLLAGRRIVGKFNLTSTIADLRRFVDAYVMFTSSISCIPLPMFVYSGVLVYK